MIEPPTQRRPSPNTLPCPFATRIVPWKYRHEPFVMPLPCSTSESTATLVSPVASIFAARPSEFTQPASAPGTLAFAHGHAVPLPSPKQYATPGDPHPPQRAMPDDARPPVTEKLPATYSAAPLPL